MYRCSGIADCLYLGGQSLVEGNLHGMEATSRDQRGDSLLRGVTRAFNDAPGTESQSAHELSVSIAAPRNGPTGRQAEQDKDT
uniref:Type VI secretion system tip protein VgrG n=1 Tax=Mesocestoides corti TaxID=53468 RepID=A0A5K3F8J2_MESCO